jgi:hypothetical protein
VQSRIRFWGEIAGIESLIFESDSGGPGSGSAITIELTHRDITVLEQASLQLANTLRAYPMAKDVANSMSPLSVQTRKSYISYTDTRSSSGRRSITLISLRPRCWRKTSAP